MPRKTRKTKALDYVGVVTGLLIASPVAFIVELPGAALCLGVAALAYAGWVAAVRFPVMRGVTTRQGQPCRNPSYGLLFGCSRPEHTQAKFRTRFSRRGG